MAAGISRGEISGKARLLIVCFFTQSQSGPMPNTQYANFRGIIVNYIQDAIRSVHHHANFAIEIVAFGGERIPARKIFQRKNGLN